MNYSRWKFFLFWENHLPFLPFLGVLGCLPVVHCHCGPGSGAPWSQKVLDALRCILSHIWAVNELFQMEIVPILRKSFTFFTLSWCARLSACGILPLQPGVLGPLKAPRSQRVVDALRWILILIWALNELFQMKFLPVLRKQFTLFPFSWCAGLTVAHCHCGRGSGGRARPPEARGF